MLTVQPHHLEKYANRMINPVRYLLEKIDAADVISDPDGEGEPVKSVKITIEEYGQLGQLYQDLGAVLAILQGYIGREADYQTTLKVLREEMGRLSDEIPEERLAELEVETESAFRAFRERMDTYRKDILRRKGIEENPDERF